MMRTNPLRRTLNHIKRYRAMFMLSGVISALYGLFSATPAYLLRIMVDTVLTAQRSDLIVPFIALFFSLFIGKSLCMYFSSYCMHWVGHNVVNDIRRELFSHIIYLPIPELKKHKTGDLIARFLNDINALQAAIAAAIRNGMRSLFEAVALLGIAFYQSIPLTLLACIVAPLIGIAMRQTGKAMRAGSTLTQNEIGSLSSLLQEIIIGIKSVKAARSEQQETSRFNSKLSNYFNAIMRCVHYESLAPALIEVIAISGCSLVLYFAAHSVISGTLTPGQLTSLFASILLAYQPIKKLVTVHAEISYGMGAAARIFALIDQTEQDKQSKQNKQILSLDPLKQTIEFKDISFGYPGKKTLFTDLSLIIHHGDRVGIIGPSGAGKSSLVDLLLRFYEPTHGQILFDGQSIADYSHKSLREQIGYVGQHPFLFNDTITANISYPNHSLSHKAIVEAARAAAADSFIERLPQKYQSIVGENGSLLSGGEKQRITIARALAHNPRILILDEATASLDSASEKKISNYLGTGERTKTVFIISHRPALLDHVDYLLRFTQSGIIREEKELL